MRLFLCALAIACASAPATAQTPAESSVTFRVVARGAAALPPQLTLTARSVDDENVVREIKVSNGQGILRAPANSRWHVRSAANEWWAAIDDVTMPAQGANHEQFALWRTGRVTGTLTPGSADMQLPSSMTWMVDSPPQPKTEPDIRRGTEFTCPVSADGKWSCSLPAMTLDLTLRVKGFTPHHRWNVVVPAGTNLPLGAFVLRRGASFVAWLDRDSLRGLKEPARAELLRPLTDAPSQTAARLREPVAAGTFNERGAVQLAPITAGSYVLEVRAKGFATARVYPVEIYEGKETVFRKAIELAPPITVRLAIDPPTDSTGAPWRLTWMRRSDFVAGYDPNVTRTTAASDGTITLPDQSPGTFNVNVQDAAGNRVWDEELHISDAFGAEHRITIEQLRVHGRVTLGGEGIAAALLFGGRDGAVRVKLVADADGKFEGALPHGGKWPVEISAAPALRAIRTIDVTGDDVDIELEDTAIAGRVTGSDGKPVANGEVSLTSAHQVLPIAADADGTFRLRAVAPGSINLRARDRRTAEASAPLELRIAADEKLENIELRVDPLHTVTGRVTSNGTPVPGARINAYAIASGHGEQRTAISDVDGVFKLQLAAIAKDALFIIAAPGRTLHSMRAMIDDRPIAIDVAPAGGTVELIASSPYRLMRDGVLLPDVELYSWIEAHGIAVTGGERLTIPDLAPGHYAACTRGGKCTEGDLAPRGSLTLDIR